jgi:phosphoribosyl-AMP cyclohydrolase
MANIQQTWLDEVAWNGAGLAPAVVQDAESGRVLMLAWMNREALRATLESGFAVYWSRSRGALWRKGEVSGHRQRVRGVRLDCDGDTLLLQVEQAGGIACHTGHARCFYRRWDDSAWREDEPVLKAPEDIYRP